ncbi:MAG: tetratricopeptide repeat protein [Betaproteobacteria bacterium]|nr:tetratricopeptide repeat protein [Betaproteobacteria bacterium]
MMTGVRTIVLVVAALVAAVMVAPSARANLGGDEAESTDVNFQSGKEAIQKQDWKKAVAFLEKAVAADPNNADARNFLGYSFRKLGDLNMAFQHYQEALRLNPKHKPAHEYIGEAYLMAGKLKEAEQHLAELNRLCSPIPCEEQKMLKLAIEDHKKK